MSDKRKSLRRPRRSASSRWGGRANRIGKIRISRRHARILLSSQGKIYLGPSLHGKPMKLIEVASGEVEDRKPHFV